jgi:hypothetical protein
MALHAALFTFVSLTASEKDTTREEPRNAIRVLMTTRTPRVSVDAIVEASGAAGDTREDEIADLVNPAPAPEPGAPSRRVMPPVQEEPDLEAAEAREIDPDYIQDAIQSWTDSYRADSTREWLATCTRKRNRRGEMVCDPGPGTDYAGHSAEESSMELLFDEVVRRPGNDARRRREMISDSRKLLALMDENPVIKVLAESRYAVYREYFRTPPTKVDVNAGFTSPVSTFVSLQLSEIFSAKDGGISLLKGTLVIGDEGLNVNSPFGDESLGRFPNAPQPGSDQ